MKVKLIYWEAPYNFSQAIYGEKYPHFGLIMGTEDDSNTVLYFTHEKKMMIVVLSKKESRFVEIAEVEVPYEIHENLAKYVGSRSELHKFSDMFLLYVAEHRKKIDRMDDILADTDVDKSPVDKIFDSLSDDVAQPFPRKPPRGI